MIRYSDGLGLAVNFNIDVVTHRELSTQFHNTYFIFIPSAEIYVKKLNARYAKQRFDL